MSSTGYIWMGNSGCLLPLLIIVNLFFGKLIFDSVGLWLGVEAVLVLIFMLKIKLMVSKMSQQFKSEGSTPASDRLQRQFHKPPGKVIDIQGQEVKDDYVA